jgi:hypothetical protein
VPPTRALLRLAASSTGLPFASWRYATHDVDIARQTSTCDWPMEGFPGADGADGAASGLQRAREGHGPAFHRLYSIVARAPVMTPEQLIAVSAADPNVAAPMDLARFSKRRGNRRATELGDEYEIVLPGPWNGPVRVIARTARSFRFATLDGHMEAGEIEFRAVPDDDGLRFEIESWARSADPVFHVLYHRLKISMELQEHMWAQFLQRAARIAGGIPGPVRIETRRSEHPSFEH